jgi:hypothetical protein
VIATLAIVVAAWVACLVPGLPAASLAAGRERPAPVLVVQAGMYGAAWYTGLTLLLGATGHFDLTTMLAVTAVAAAVLAVAVMRRGRPDLQWPRLDLVAAGLLAALAVGVVARSANVVDSLLWVGDPGAYTNYAWLAATTSQLSSDLTAVPSAVMVPFIAAFGTGSADAAMAFLASLALAAVPAAAWGLGASRRSALIVTAAAAVCVTPVWYARIASAETPYVTFLALILLELALLHRSPRVIGPLLATAAGAALMQATRADSMRLVAACLAFAVIRGLVAPRSAGRREAAWAAAVVAGTGLGYTFDAWQSNAYLARQFDAVASLTNRIRDAGLLEVSVQLALAVAALAAITFALGVGAARWSTADGRPRAGQVIAALTAVAALAGLYGTAISRSYLLDAGGRFGILLIALAVAGFVVGFGRPDSIGAVTVAGSLFALIGALEAGHQFYGLSRNHAWFLYWDRYLFSGAFLPVILLSVIGADRLLRIRTVARYPLVALLVAAAGVALLVPTTVKATRETLFAGSGDQLRDLQRVTGTAPIVWSVLHPFPGSFYPNTVDPWINTLTVGFQHRVLNPPTTPFAPDAAVTFEAATALAATAGARQVAVVEATLPAAPPAHAPQGSTGSWRWSYAGRSDAKIPVLPKREQDPETWRTFEAVFDVWRLEQRPG